MNDIMAQEQARVAQAAQAEADHHTSMKAKADQAIATSEPRKIEAASADPPRFDLKCPNPECEAKWSQPVDETDLTCPTCKAADGMPPGVRTACMKIGTAGIEACEQAEKSGLPPAAVEVDAEASIGWVHPRCDRCGWGWSQPQNAPLKCPNCKHDVGKDGWSLAVKLAAEQVTAAEAKLNDAKQLTKECREDYDRAVASLMQVIEEADQPALPFADPAPDNFDSPTYLLPVGTVKLDKSDDEKQAQYWATPLEDIGLSTAICERLFAWNFRTVGDIAQRTRDDRFHLTNINGIGEAAAAKIEAAMESRWAEIEASTDPVETDDD